jgi:hypothetical protein
MKEELKNSITSEISGLSDNDANLIIEKYCRITEPKSENPTTEFLTIDSKKKKGSSIKPGNIFLNMRKLIIDSSEIGLTIAGVAAQPYLIPLAALVIWNKVWSRIKIDLDESHAMTIKLMWENRDKERNWIEEEKAFRLYNDYLESLNRNTIVLREFQSILSDLERMKCIEKTGNGIWWLREWVKKSI